MSYDDPQTLGEFFDRLQAGIFPPNLPELPAEWLHFRRECEGRHEEGESIFGDEYLRRNNRVEGHEEASDLANYVAYDHFQHAANEGDDDDIALVLSIAKHAYEAHRDLRRLSAKREGTPG